MKKSILVLCVIASIFGISASGLVNTGEIDRELDLLYKVDSRYIATITKDELKMATSVLDIVPKSATEWWKIPFTSVTIKLLDDNSEIAYHGESNLLNAAQKDLLQSIEYSSNIYVRADGRGSYSGRRMEDFVYFITVVPENQAEYESGHEALIQYLRTGSLQETEIIKQDQLKPGQFRFKVTSEGLVENVALLSSSGYERVDQKLINLISQTSGAWKPATDSNGEKIDQILYFFFGMEGC